MDLTVTPENLCKTVQSIRELLKDNIIPRLTELELQLELLRFNTWPVCQSLKERSQLTDFHAKKEFLRDLSTDEVTALIMEKASVSIRELAWSSHALHREELMTILGERNFSSER